MGWLRLVGSLKSLVSFAKEPCKSRISSLLKESPHPQYSGCHCHPRCSSGLSEFIFMTVFIFIHYWAEAFCVGFTKMLKGECAAVLVSLNLFSESSLALSLSRSFSHFVSLARMEGFSFVLSLKHTQSRARTHTHKHSHPRRHSHSLFLSHTHTHTN